MRVSTKGALVIDKSVYEAIAKTYEEVILELRNIVASPEFASDGYAAKLIDDLLRDYANRAAIHLRRSQKKPGRPKKKLPSIGLINTAMRDASLRTPREIGRPSKRPVGWYRRLVREVDMERERLVTGNINKGTVTDAIKSLVKNQVLPTIGGCAIRDSASHFRKIKAAYYREKSKEKS